MPYVVESLHRYNSEVKGALLRQNSQARRRQQQATPPTHGQEGEVSFEVLGVLVACAWEQSWAQEEGEPLSV